MQQRIATGNNPALNQAAIIPNNNAANPVTGDSVVFIIAGNVITDNVTYGT